MYIYSFNNSKDDEKIVVWEIIDGDPSQYLTDYIFGDRYILEQIDFYSSWRHLRWLTGEVLCRKLGTDEEKIMNISLLQGRIKNRKFWLRYYDMDTAIKITTEYLEGKKEEMTYAYLKYNKELIELEG